MRAYKLGQGKRCRDFEFEGIDECPAVGPIDSLGIEGEAGSLESFQAPVDGAQSGFFPLSEFGHS